MPFTLDRIVPWGRSFDEYVAMFALSPANLRERILGCGDGPAAFNGVATRLGSRIVSVDPIYVFSRAQLEERVRSVYEPMLAETERNKEEFVWNHVRSVQELGNLRWAAMSEFLQDYEQGSLENRYIAGELPRLPFKDQAFGLALCSHFLFLYSRHLDYEFHIESIEELCRVAREIRIFPLNELGARPSRHLARAVEMCRQLGLRPQIVTVNYEFQKGANRMLVLHSDG